MNSPEKVRALGIAPYEGMKSMMLSIASEYPEIELTVFVGDLQRGVEIAQNNFHGDYDVVISRGGTAKLLGRQTELFVVEIEITAYDILRVLRLAENIGGKIAIVGFANITGGAHTIRELFQFSFDVFTVNDEAEVEQVMGMVKDEGYHTVLCDVVANATAARLGLNTLLITSGAESTRNAFERAITFKRSYRKIQEENIFLRTLLEEQSNKSAVFRQDGQLYFSSLPPQNSGGLLDILRELIPLVPDDESRRFVRNFEGGMYTIHGKKMELNRTAMVSFSLLRSKTLYNNMRGGIQYMDRETAEEAFYKSFYCVTGLTGNLQAILDSSDTQLWPIIIFGEYGTGKDMAANLLYFRSRLCNSPMVKVDCTLVNDKTWEFILDHHRSPLNSTDTTVYIKNINTIPDQRRRSLLAAIADRGFCASNRLIISYSHTQEEPVAPSVSDFINQLHGVRLDLPSLRDMPESVPALANLYLSKINVDMARQIVGIEPDGITLLKEYSWPHNFVQFQRVIEELARFPTASVIPTHQVAALLKRERGAAAVHTRAEDPVVSLDLSRTLPEINRDIIALVVQRCGGNQSAAAKQLGISRTTLWRSIKE